MLAETSIVPSLNTKASVTCVTHTLDTESITITVPRGQQTSLLTSFFVCLWSCRSPLVCSATVTCSERVVGSELYLSLSVCGAVGVLLFAQQLLPVRSVLLAVRYTFLCLSVEL